MVRIPPGHGKGDHPVKKVLLLYFCLPVRLFIVLIVSYALHNVEHFDACFTVVASS